MAVTKRTRYEVLRRDGHACRYCGQMAPDVKLAVDHVVPVDMYLPGCPPRPEMLIDAILKLHDQVQHTKLGANRQREIEERETGALRALPTSEMKGLLR